MFMQLLRIVPALTAIASAPQNVQMTLVTSSKSPNQIHRSMRLPFLRNRQEFSGRAYPGVMPEGCGSLNFNLRLRGLSVFTVPKRYITLARVRCCFSNLARHLRQTFRVWKLLIGICRLRAFFGKQIVQPSDQRAVFYKSGSCGFPCRGMCNSQRGFYPHHGTKKAPSAQAARRFKTVILRGNDKTTFRAKPAPGTILALLSSQISSD